MLSVEQFLPEDAVHKVGCSHPPKMLIVQSFELLQSFNPTVDGFVYSLLKSGVVLREDERLVEFLVQHFHHNHIVCTMLHHTLAVLSSAQHTVGAAAGLSTDEHCLDGCRSGAQNL